MPFFADRDAVAQRLGPHRCRPRLGHPRLQLQQAGIRDVRERKIGIIRNGARQTLLGAGVRRQQEIDSRHIIVDSLGRGRSDRKIEAVAQFHRRRPALVLAATVALPVIRRREVSRRATECADRLRQLLASPENGAQ